MNKKQLRKELNRIQKVHENTVKRIDNLEINIEEANIKNKELKKINEEQKEKINEQSLQINEQSLNIEEQKEKINEQSLQINEQKEKINEQSLQINEQKEKINEQSLQINEQSLQINEQSLQIEELNNEQEDIKKVQERQGIDIAALAKALNNLEDKKIHFEDEYAKWEDISNKLSEFIEQNPECKGLGVIDHGAIKQAMENAIKSIEHIDVKLSKLYKLMKDIQKFDEFNYNSVMKKRDD